MTWLINKPNRERQSDRVEESRARRPRCEVAVCSSTQTHPAALLLTCFKELVRISSRAAQIKDGVEPPAEWLQ